MFALVFGRGERKRPDERVNPCRWALVTWERDGLQHPRLPAPFFGGLVRGLSTDSNLQATVTLFHRFASCSQLDSHRDRSSGQASPDGGPSSHDIRS